MVEPRKEPYSPRSSLPAFVILLVLTIAPVGSLISLFNFYAPIHFYKIHFSVFSTIPVNVAYIDNFSSNSIVNSILSQPSPDQSLDFEFEPISYGIEATLGKLWIGNNPVLLNEALTKTPAEGEATTTPADTTIISTPWWTGWLVIPLLSGLLWWLVKGSGISKDTIAAVASHRKPETNASSSDKTQAPPSVKDMLNVAQSLNGEVADRVAAMKTLEGLHQGQLSAQVQSADFQADLIVDSRQHCYYIDPVAMNKLQKQTAVSMVLQPGAYDIMLKSGAFDCRIAAGQHGEPLVLLWLYGGKVVNHKTGVAVGTTWSSLNGYKDVLSIDVQEPTTLAAFFIDTQLEDNEGEVLLVVEGINQVASLIVHSQENCYRFDPASMQRLEQENSVSRKLQVGTYRFQIKQGTFNYRTNSGHTGEPWVLLWFFDGKVMNHKTGIEVGATWISLNGYEDSFWIDVRQPTTLCALFLDTFLDDNDGKVVISMTYSSYF